VGNFQVVEVPLIARRITSTCLKLLLQAVHETGFLRAGEGPKKYKEKKVAMLYMFGHHPSSLRKHGSGKGQSRKKK
jgi:hypothetical protein